MFGSGCQPSRLLFPLLAAACLLLLVSPAAAVDATGPMTISEPGTYVLVNDITSTDSPVFVITASDVVFDGQGHLIELNNPMGGVGFSVSGGDTPVTNVTIRDVRLNSGAPFSGGISFNNVQNSTVQGVSTTGNDIGINLGPGCTDNTISNSTINDCYTGVYTADTTLNTTVSGNTLASNDLGISLSWSRGNMISDNTITGEPSSTGLHLYLTNENTIRNNTVTGNDYGIRFYCGPIQGSTISDNTVTGNDYGIYFGSSSSDQISGNTIANNNFNNTENAYFEAAIGANSWNTAPTAGTNILGGPALGGNFWGTPVGTGFSQTHQDSNHDGFCDDLNPLGTDNTDNLPLHIWTPAPAPAVTAVTAGFYAFGHVGQAPYSVRFMDQSTGSPTAWTWDFGDGTTSTEQSPTHIYNRTGAFNVALTASNDQASDTAIQYRCVIVNTIPVGNFTANQTAGSMPFTVQFTDQSTSSTDGYLWQFGDGSTSTEQDPVHTYTHPGSYTVTLTVTVPDYGSAYTQKPGYITVTDPPTVGFSANVTAGPSPLGVQFTESTTGFVQYFYWQFGDGSTSFDRNPVHVYDKAGKYTVSLYAIGSNGTQVKTVDQYINVTDQVTPTPTTPAPVNTTMVPTTPVPTNTTVIPTVTTVVPTTTTSSGFNGPHTIPGTLQAEDYDLGGEGIAYHDTTPGNIGGAYRHDDVDIEQLDTDGSPNIGWIRAGEWLAYTVNVSTTGTYDAGFRVASSYTGSSIQVYVDDGTTPVATVTVPNTGDWPVFRTVSVPVTLPAGQHRLKLSFPTDFVNINWIRFAKNDGV